MVNLLTKETVRHRARSYTRGTESIYTTAIARRQVKFFIHGTGNIFTKGIQLLQAR